MKAVIHWHDLPPNTVLKLSLKSHKNIINSLKLKFKTKKEMAKGAGVDRQQIRNYEKFTSNFSVRTLTNISKVLRIKMNELDFQIIEIGRKKLKIKTPKLPFNLASPEGVALISIVNSEGHIPKQKGTTMHIRVNEIELLQAAIEYAKKIFGGFKVDIKKTRGKNSHEIFFPAVISDSLEIAGVTRGSKSKNNPKIPEYIMQNTELGKIYLGWSFACEMECSAKVVKLTRDIDVSEIVPIHYFDKFDYGVIFKNKIPSALIKIIEEKKCKLLEDETQILKKFGIYKNTQIANLWKTRDNRITAAWKIVISDKENMKKLLLIKIPLEYKSQKLEFVVSSYKRDNITKIETYRKTIKKAVEIQSKKQFFERKELVDYYKKYTKWADRKVDSHLKKFTEKNIATKISSGKYRITNPVLLETSL